MKTTISNTVTTIDPTATTAHYTIMEGPVNVFEIYDNKTNQWLRSPDGATRKFTTRGAARKRISRELSGDFHR